MKYMKLGFLDPMHDVTFLLKQERCKRNDILKFERQERYRAE